MNTESTGQAFEAWCIVELMGHQRMAGFVTERTIGGASFINVHVPAPGPAPGSEDGREPVPGHPSGGYDRMLSPSAIYAINPVDEQTARLAANVFRPAPIQPYEMRQLSAAGAAHDTDPDKYSDDFDIDP